MQINLSTVEALKGNGNFFAAGALAYQLGYTRAYGCHYGLRSSLERDRSEFWRGYDAASHDHTS